MQKWSLGILLINLFINFWLCWVFISVRGLSLVAASGVHSSSRCVGLSLSRPLLLRSTGSRCAGSVVVAHGPSCSAACGILPEPGLEPRTRARTLVPCIGGQVLNHCATREAPGVWEFQPLKLKMKQLWGEIQIIEGPQQYLNGTQKITYRDSFSIIQLHSYLHLLSPYSAGCLVCQEYRINTN